MTIRHLPPHSAPRLPVDWRPARRDLGPPRLDAIGRAALFVGAMLAGSYAVGWLVGFLA